MFYCWIIGEDKTPVKVLGFNIFQGKTNPVSFDRILCIIIMFLDRSDLGSLLGPGGP
jgi:hypothetical protein